MKVQGVPRSIQRVSIIWLDIYFMAGQPTPLTYPPARSKGLIASALLRETNGKITHIHIDVIYIHVRPKPLAPVPCRPLVQ